jgi:hypothetical protein
MEYSDEELLEILEEMEALGLTEKGGENFHRFAMEAIEGEKKYFTPKQRDWILGLAERFGMI